MSRFDDNNLIMTRNNLLNEMNLLSYEEFNYIPDINSWSIAQVCNHLAITEETVAKAIAYGLKKSSVSYVPKNMENLLDRSFKIEAPEVVKPQIESIEVYQITDQLNHSRNSLMSILDAVEDLAILAEKSVKHPLFGDLSLNQWLELIPLHEQRHLAQIEEIRSQYKESIL